MASAVTTHAGYGTLSLRSGGTVSASAGTSTISVSKLAVQAVGAVDLALGGTVGNAVGTVVASVSGSGSDFAFRNATDVTVGTVDGLNGITTNGGGVSVTLPAATLTVAKDISSGAGAITLASAKSIAVSGGASVTATGGGVVSLSANRQTTATSGFFVGIDVAGTVSGGSGGISLAGTGGDGGDNQHGVYFHNGGSVNTTAGTGAVSVTGTGGASLANYNYGVYVSGTNSKVTSAGGPVSVVGVGGGSGTFRHDNYGVYLGVGGVVTSAGTTAAATVSVVGTGGAGSNSNVGVYLNGFGATITSSGGNVSVTGAGGGSGGAINSSGVRLLTGTISAGGSGTVTVTGTGYNSSGGNYGVLLENATSVIASGGGAVNVSATGGSGGGDYALILVVNATIASGGTAALTISADSVYVETGAGYEGTLRAGTAGDGTVTLGPKTAGTLIDLGGADVLGVAPTLGLSDAELDRITAGVVVVGTSTAGGVTVSANVSPANAPQLELVTGGSIGGTGTITATRLALTAVNGVGTSAAPLATAVSGIEATTATGGIFVSNTGSLAIGGVNATLAGVRVTAAGGDIALASTGGLSVATAGDGVSGPGNVSVSADDMTITAPITAGGTLTLRQASTTARPIDLGNGTAANALGLSDAELGQPLRRAGADRPGR